MIGEGNKGEELKECRDLLNLPSHHSSLHISPSKNRVSGGGRVGGGCGDKTPDVPSFDGALPCQCILAFLPSSFSPSSTHPPQKNSNSTYFIVTNREQHCQKSDKMSFLTLRSVHLAECLTCKAVKNQKFVFHGSEDKRPEHVLNIKTVHRNN